MRSIPSTKALQAFVAVTRFGGIRAAAAELCITQSAVSHQIKQLETLLGVSLFVKQGRHLRLNKTGQDYLQHVSSTLHQLEQASTQVSRYQSRPPLTIAAPPSFMANWLLPNLGKFEQLHPGTPIRLLEQLTLDRSDQLVDIAIEYRFQAQVGAQSERIFDDSLSLFAAPDYVAAHEIESIDDLARVRLIETERRLVSWQDVLWDKPWIKTHSFLSVPYSLHALTAASLGYGVALGNTINGKRLLQDGALVMPFELDAARRPDMPKYFMTVAQGKGGSEALEKFLEWMREESVV